jgi:hypothetical protein
MASDDVLRIANCSGFYGDRLSAAREMVEGGPIDVLTGDYLAELTPRILFRDKPKSLGAGYARTFLRQMEEVLGTCLARCIRVGQRRRAQPAGPAELDQLATKLGVRARIAHVEETTSCRVSPSSRPKASSSVTSTRTSRSPRSTSRW